MSKNQNILQLTEQNELLDNKLNEYSGGNNFTFQRTDGISTKININNDNRNDSGFFTSNNKKKKPVFKARRSPCRRLKK